jgi:hypothetical protein
MAFEVEYRWPRRAVIIFKIMTARLALRYSTSMAVKFGASHHGKNRFLHGDSRVFLLAVGNLLRRQEQVPFALN